MLPATIWGFLTALLIVLVGVYLLFPDALHNLHFPRESGSTTSMTLLCTGGSGALCCGKDHSEYTSGLALTIDQEKKRVIVFLEGNGSATGDIIEYEQSHLLFGKKSCSELTAAPIRSSTGTSAGASTGTDTGASTGSNTGAGTGTNTGASTGASTGTNTGASTGTSTGSNTGTSTPRPPEACKVANGEINRLTGLADIRIKDETGQTVVQWNKIQCGRKWQKF
jgi:hypothetical protein